MILILWTATAVIGSTYSTFVLIRYTRRWLRLRQQTDNGELHILLRIARGKVRLEAGRLLSELGLLSLGIFAVLAGSTTTTVSYSVLVLFFVNWTLAVNSILDHGVNRTVDQYVGSPDRG